MTSVVRKIVRVSELSEKSDNSSLNLKKHPTFCVPKRKIKVHVTVQESPKLRKKYKIKVTSADNKMYYQRSRRGRNSRDNSRSRLRTPSVSLNEKGDSEKRLSNAEIDQVLQDIRSRDQRSRSTSRPPPPKGTPPPLAGADEKRPKSFEKCQSDTDQVLKDLRSNDIRPRSRDQRSTSRDQRSASRPPPPKATPPPLPKDFENPKFTPNTKKDDKTDNNKDWENEEIEAQSFLNDASDSKSDNSGSNWTENLAYCAPKRKVKVNVTIQESPRTVRRKKYKINVQSSADNENMPHNVPQIVPGYKINAQSADYENVPDNVPKTVPNNVPKTVPDNMSKTVPDNVPKTVPDNVPKTVPENVQKGGGRETGVILLILKQRYQNSQQTSFNTRPELTKDLK